MPAKAMGFFRICSGSVENALYLPEFSFRFRIDCLPFSVQIPRAARSLLRVVRDLVNALV